MEDVRNYNRIEKRINVLLNEVEMLCKQYEETNNDSFRKLLKEEMNFGLQKNTDLLTIMK